MQNDEVMLQCPNDLCKVVNSESGKFCQRCGTPLIKRYLWAVGEGIETCLVGELVDERYLLTSHRIFLDTKPGLPPEAPYLDISNAIKPYLRLVTYRLQVPQAYGLLPLGKKDEQEILLLEQAPIYTDTEPQEGQLMPELTLAWKTASSLRQLNWLWQIAQLWQPLSSEGVASSLLVPQLLRVDRSLVRLLQLQQDSSEQPTLSQLGEFWSQLATQAQPSITEFLKQLSQDLQQAKVQSAEQLIAILDRGLSLVGQASARNFKISTCTDTGPSRQRNEDACYPHSGTTIAKPPDSKAIAIVCDGIGGHEGGNVASNLAIETLQQQVDELLLDDTNLDPTTLSDALENFVCTTNDRISQRNDKEHRIGRQRMGTTLVMAVGHRHEIYVAHVGDSRAYWITRTGCYQITLDDDVAAREVRLGYAIYRDALQQPSAGSLVQAMGMSASLHPTVQRFVLDEDCVFLLCSDGLSDYDLVDQCWQTEILPILDGKVDVATLSQRLVEIGNTRNGHDNITVALAYCQVKSCEPVAPLSYSLATETAGANAASQPEATDLRQASARELDETAFSLRDTQLLPSTSKPRRLFVPALLGISLLMSLGGGLLLAYLANSGKLTGKEASADLTSSRRSPAPVLPASNSLVQPGDILITKQKISLNRLTKPEDRAIASSTGQFSPIQGTLPAGSVVKVLEQKPFAQDYWLNLKVLEACAISKFEPTSATPPKSIQSSPASKPATTGTRLLQSGEDGWIPIANIKQYLLPITSVASVELTCSSQPVGTPVSKPTPQSAQLKQVEGASPLKR